MSSSPPSDACWHLSLAGSSFSLGAPTHIGIPLSLDGRGLGLFGAPPAAESALRVGDFSARVSAGSPVNVSTLTITPHCNGTHTESARHLDDRSPAIEDLLPDAPVPALLVTLEPVSPEDAGDEAPSWTEAGDRLITAAMLERKVSELPEAFCHALVVRTGTDVFSDSNPPYLTPSAAGFIRSQGVQHLLVDLPSIDRLEDGGRLAAHRSYWNLDAPRQERKTITEMIAVPTSLPDGAYALIIHAARMDTDAVPSTPVLFALQDVTPL